MKDRSEDDVHNEAQKFPKGGPPSVYGWQHQPMRRAALASAKILAYRSANR